MVSKTNRAWQKTKDSAYVRATRAVLSQSPVVFATVKQA